MWWGLRFDATRLHKAQLPCQGTRLCRVYSGPKRTSFCKVFFSSVLFPFKKQATAHIKKKKKKELNTVVDQADGLKLSALSAQRSRWACIILKAGPQWFLRGPGCSCSCASTKPKPIMLVLCSGMQGSDTSAHPWLAEGAWISESFLRRSEQAAP